MSLDTQQYTAFLSMTAHDLLAPLRKLGVFTEKLTSRLDISADEDAGKYIQRIHACIAEMRSIVNASLAIAESIPENMQIGEVDSSAITKEILGEKSSLIRETGASITVSDLPALEADQKQMRSLFREIIENAFVFVKKEQPLKLDISCSELMEDERDRLGLRENAYWKFRFRDNGIGFNPDEAERIFEPTVRLNGKSGFPGNGFGLALVKKIVSNHRGIVLAESGPEGSSFIVILPKTQD